MILYIHGFGSSAQSAKAQKLKAHYKARGIDFLAPSLSYIPTLAIETLEDIIVFAQSKAQSIHLIGSSMGGYMSIYLAHKYGLKAVLINPSINPTQSLQKMLGMNASYYDLSSFEWTRQHLASLQRYKVSTLEVSNFLLLLQTGDETLDYQEAVEFFEHQGMEREWMVIEEGGSHSFEDIESKWSLIARFFAQNRET